jgi:hypothetical protein
MGRSRISCITNWLILHAGRLENSVIVVSVKADRAYAMASRAGRPAVEGADGRKAETPQAWTSNPAPGGNVLRKVGHPVEPVVRIEITTSRLGRKKC